MFTTQPIWENLISGISTYPYYYINISVSLASLLFNLCSFNLVVLIVWNVVITTATIIPQPHAQSGIVLVISILLSHFTSGQPQVRDLSEKRQTANINLKSLAIRLMQYYQYSLVVISVWLVVVGTNTTINIQDLNSARTSHAEFLSELLLNHNRSQENVSRCLALVEIIVVNCCSVLNVFAFVLIPVVLNCAYARRLGPSGLNFTS
ncbi:uncharacterized protein LODBEIA_P46260 [Lodderomyces beijingensis]|uniref:Uncharacterized protein n=1 Tax=Lodderomyces beijingensis TaxID=1775926 RepID=A0ABP0ZST0_9ASCO